MASWHGGRALAELARHLHLVLSDGGPEPAPGEGSRVWRINDSVARRELLLARLGWCHLPRHQVEDDLAAGDLVRLSTRPHRRTPLTVSLYVAHPRDRTPGPAGRWWFERL